MSIAENIAALSQCKSDICAALNNKGITNIENAGLDTLINNILILAKPDGFLLEQGFLNISGVSSVAPEYAYSLSKPISYILLLWEINKSDSTMTTPIWCWVDNTGSELVFYASAYYTTTSVFPSGDETSVTTSAAIAVNNYIFSNVEIRTSNKKIVFTVNSSITRSLPAGTGKILIFYSNGE